MEKISQLDELRNKKVAIVYDWLDTSHGGAERVLKQLFILFPNATLFTSFGKIEIAKKLGIKRIEFSPLQKLPKFLQKNRILMMVFLPFVFETFNLQGYEIVISMSSFVGNSVIVKPSSLHLAIVLTPSRYLFIESDFPAPSILQKLLKFRPFQNLKNHLKCAEITGVKRADQVIAISQEVERRIEKYYQTKSVLIYPPFDYTYWQNLKAESPDLNFNSKDYFLFVGRLTRFKRVDLLIEVFNQLPSKNLVIVGTGKEKNKLENMIKGENITLIENCNDNHLKYMYENAKALIMPQKEEFGYTALEAQALGCAIICFADSGTSEIIQKHPHNAFFENQSSSSLLTIVNKYDKITSQAPSMSQKDREEFLEKFSVENFSKRLMQLINIHSKKL